MEECVLPLLRKTVKAVESPAHPTPSVKEGNAYRVASRDSFSVPPRVSVPIYNPTILIAVHAKFLVPSAPSVKAADAKATLVMPVWCSVLYQMAALKFRRTATVDSVIIAVRCIAQANPLVGVCAIPVLIAREP